MGFMADFTGEAGRRAGLKPYLTVMC